MFHVLCLNLGCNTDGTQVPTWSDKYYDWKEGCEHMWEGTYMCLHARGA